MSDLQPLIEKLEAATEGSRELDRLVRNTREKLPISAEELAADERLQSFIAPFTTSIDCAVGLVPKGWTWLVERQESGDFCGQVSRKQSHPTVWAKTPALALCIAALKARASA